MLGGSLAVGVGGDNTVEAVEQYLQHQSLETDVSSVRITESGEGWTSGQIIDPRGNIHTVCVLQ